MSETESKNVNLGSGGYVLVLICVLALVKTFEPSVGITWLTVLLPWIIWLAVKAVLAAFGELMKTIGNY